MKKNLSITIFIFFASISLQLFSQESNDAYTKLLRFPNSSQNEIAFNYGGDIYITSINGGPATKLTSSIGIEQMPRFSPDGKTLAFIANYDGNPEIYTISTTGGEPKRITYSMDMPHMADRQGPDKIIMQWSVDGKEIVYRARNESWNVLVGKLYRVRADGGGLPIEIPVPRSGYASLSPDGNKIAYNRIFREYRTWKRYRGGQADDIWIYDFTTKELTNITDNVAQDIIPMWAGNKIYYASDRDKTMNIFCYDLNTNQTKKITNYDYYDVKFPSLGTNFITYENGGEIYKLDLSNDAVTKINIRVIDDGVAARTELVDVSNRISGFDISPDGKRGLLSARGEIFIVPSSLPVESSVTTNITNTSGINERNPVWSPNGDWIAYISDKTGQEEVWVVQPNGKNATQFTSNSTAYRYELLWSPDGKKIINSDNARNLTIIDFASKTEKVIYKSKTYSIRNFSWSPDNKWVAFSTENEHSLGVVYIYNIVTNQQYQITSEFFNNDFPIFSKDGKYLFFTSDRDFRATINNLEWNYSYNNMNKIYGICLRNDDVSPFRQYIDYNIKPEEKPKLTKKEKEIIANADIIIDIDGLQDRIFVLPIPVTSYYYNLYWADKKLFYNRGGTLYSFNFEDLEEKEVGKVTSFAITPDEKNIMFKSNNKYYISKLTSKLLSTSEIKDNNSDKQIDLSGLKMNLNHKEEWEQVFNESWRHYSEFFYAPNMHGVNWKQMHTKYGELLPYVRHRTDLTYIIGEMIGELNAGHCYVTGGEMPQVATIGIGLLGIDLELEQSTGKYKIKRILQGQNWDEKLRSPLTEPAINVKVGDYLLAIDDNILTSEINPYSYLVGKVNKTVKLTIESATAANTNKNAKSNPPNNSNISGSDIFVKTIENESDLRYFNWVEERRHIVDSVSNGRIGYVHIPDMATDNGLNWFAKYFYPQARKEGLIIDDRYNGGGNVSPMIIERLNRELTMAKIGRNSETVFTIPSSVMTGPIVCLINQQSMSDGDMFPFQFHALNIGPIIGKRSWGGVVGIYGSLPLLDGSSINKPEVANFGAKSGNWELEGVGMTPDFDVDNHPAKEYEGTDEQLLFGIQKVFELMQTNKKNKIPAIPPYPDKH